MSAGADADVARLLVGKVALVTGGSRGLGRAIAEALAGAGADVVVNYRVSHDAAEETAACARSLGRRAADAETLASFVASSRFREGAEAFLRREVDGRRWHADGGGAARVWRADHPAAHGCAHGR